MVSSRSQSGTITAKSSSALKRTRDSVGASEHKCMGERGNNDERDTPKTSSSKRRKMAITSGTKPAMTTTPKVFGKPARRRKDLGILPTIPLDVLYEILGQLGPKDLLSLSRTNRLWRRTVVSTGTKFLWKDARKIYDAPDPAEGFTEEGWARLLFDGACEGCGKRGPTAAVDWRLLMRVCTACKRNHLMYDAKFKKTFPGEDKDALMYTPHTYTGVSKGGCGAGKFYWDEDIKWTLDLMKTLSGRHLEEWKRKAALRIESRDELASSYEEWSAQMKEMAADNTEEGRQKRLKAVTQRFLQAGFELIDIQATFSVKTAGIYSGTPHVTDAAWTRLRPQLEPQLVIRRNQRVAKELAPAIEARIEILKPLCSAFLDRTVRPSERYCFPPIETIRAIPDFLSVIEAGENEVITAKHFGPVVDNLDKYTAKYHEGQKNALKVLVPEDRQGMNVEPPCHLARHVFRRDDPKFTKYFWVSLQQTGKIKDEVLVGWPMIGTHRFPRFAQLEIRPGVHLKMPAGFTYNLPVSRTSSQLISLAGLNPASATVQDMDTKNPRFVHKDFDTAIGYPVFSWRAALGVSSVLMLNSYRTNPCQFRLATPAEEAETKNNEEALQASAAAWSCNHCVRFLSSSKAEKRDVVIKHLEAEHGVVDPVPLEDYFVNERCRHALERPYEILVTDVQKYQCDFEECESCARLVYRRFTKDKLAEHLKKVWPQMHDRTVEGTHYFAVASGRDALSGKPNGS